LLGGFVLLLGGLSCAELCFVVAPLLVLELDPVAGCSTEATDQDTSTTPRGSRRPPALRDRRKLSLDLAGDRPLEAHEQLLVEYSSNAL
jgi:hypothetical protein